MMTSDEKGHVIWITGLSGAGKTAIAKELQCQLRGEGFFTLLLDGDAMREAMRDPHYGYDRSSRLAGAYRYGRFAKLLAEQGSVIIVSTISLFHEIHDWNRKNIDNYFEVFVQADEQTRRDRDPKKLYSDHDQGKNQNMAGMDVAAEFPKDPHLILENNAHDVSIGDQAQRLFIEWRNIKALGRAKVSG